MTLQEGIGYLVAIAVPAAVIPLRARVLAGWKGPAGLLEVLASPQHLAALAGIAVGWGAPAWLRQDLVPVPGLGFLFLGGWLGLAVGSALDLRVSRKLPSPVVLHESAQAAAAVATVALLAWAAGSLPVRLPPTPAALVLLVAGICLAGPALPSRRRQRGGGHVGFWDPTLTTGWAVLLAALGGVGAAGLQVSFHLPRWLSSPMTAELGGPLPQMLWATAAGAAAGLLADLASREELDLGGLYLRIAAVILVSSGLAAAMGMSPVWVGAVAGFWLVNATLRRMDLLQVIERGMALPRIAAPALAGWCVGAAMAEGGLRLPVVVSLTVVILAVRPAIRIGGILQLRRRLQRRGGSRPRGIDPGMFGIDEVGLILVGVAGAVLGERLFADTLLAVLTAQWLLGVGTHLWRQRLFTRAAAAG